MVYLEEYAYKNSNVIAGGDNHTLDDVARGLLKIKQRRQDLIASYGGDTEAIKRDLCKYIDDYSFEDYKAYITGCEFMREVDPDVETLPEEFLVLEMMARYDFLYNELSEGQQAAVNSVCEAKKQAWTEAGYISSWFGDLLDKWRQEAEKAANKSLRKTLPAGFNIDPIFTDACMQVLRTDITSVLGAIKKSDKVAPERGSKGAVFARDNMRFKFEQDIRSIGVGADQLLNTAMAKCAQGDHSGKGVSVVEFPLVDYVRAMGRDVDDPQKGKSILKEARKAIDKNLKILAGVLITWTDAEDHGAYGNKLYKPFIEAAGFINGNIHIEFRPEFVEHMKKERVIMQYPPGLIKIDPLSYNSYYIGKKIAEVYYNSKNIAAGRRDILSVKTLLSAMDLKDYEEQKATNNRWWKERIKQRLEICLGDLRFVGMLKEYDYCKAKKVPLSEDERRAADIDYTFFTSLYVTFSLVESEKALASAAVKKKQITRAKRRRKKKK